MLNSLSVGKAAILLLVIAVAIRVGIVFIYQPVTLPDSGTYSELASQILNMDFRNHLGLRTPGYPLVLLLAGQNLFVVWLIQAVLGVLVSLLLFWICFAYTGNTVWSLLTGLLHSLALNQLFFEANILSETFTTFAVVLSVACFARALNGGPRPRNGIVAGLVSALATLTRPLYVYLGPLFVILVILFERNGKRLATSLGVAFLLPLLGWATFNKVTIDYFGLSTFAGYNLTNHSGGFIEKAGDQYATIRDIFLKHREEKIAETGRHQMTIMAARDELLEKTGLDDATLSRQFAQLSLELFIRNPMLYLRSVAESWASFWAVPLYMDKSKLTIPGAARVVAAVFAFERMFLLMMNFLAIAVSAWVLVRATLRRLQGTPGLPIPVIIACVILGASVLQALVESGENARYGIPTQSLAVTLVLLAAWDLRSAIKAKRLRNLESRSA